MKPPTIFDPLTTTLDKPLLIEASAGTGKTYSLMHLILRILVEKQIPLEKILVVTFTNNATYELKSRLRAKLNEIYNALHNSSGNVSDAVLADQIKAWQSTRTLEDILDSVKKALDQLDDASVFTIHSFCQRMIQQYAFSSKKSFELEISECDSLKARVVDDVVRYEVENTIKDSETRLKFLQQKEDFLEYLGSLSALPERMLEGKTLHFDITSDDSFDGAQLKSAYGNFFKTAPKKLRELEKQNHLMTFNDILIQMEENLQTKDFVDQVSNAYDAVLIDEFQDTDPVQYSIFKTIFLDPAKEGRPVIFVGDPKQSIYSFRPADIECYFDAREFIDNTAELTKNYRSTPSLVAAANLFFSDKGSKKVFVNNRLDYSAISSNENLLPLFEKDGKYFKPVTPFELWLETPEEQYSSSGGNIENLEDWAVAEDIAKMLNGNYYLGSPGRRLCSGDLVVLVRNRDHAKGLIKELAKRHIRCIIDDKDNVLKSREASEILNILLAMEDSSTHKNMNAARTTRVFGENLSSIMESEPARIRARLAIEQACKTFSSRGVLAAFTEIFNEYDVTRRLLKQSGGERALTNYQHILELLYKQNRKIKTISGLIRWMQKQTKSKDDQNLRRESDADLIRIETIHHAKGLEYPVVYMLRVGLGKKAETLAKLPTLSRHKDSNGEIFYWISTNFENKSNLPVSSSLELEESIRITYVAFTRASSRLVIPMFYKRVTPKKDGRALIRKEGLNGAFARVISPSADRNQLHSELFERLPEELKKVDPVVQKALTDALQDPKCPFAGLVDSTAINNFKAAIIDKNYYGLFNDLNTKTTVQIPSAPDLNAASPAQCEIDWIQTSFTGLTKNLPWTKEAPSLDESSDDDAAKQNQGIAPAQTENDPLRFKPPGVSALTYGDFLHKLLEEVEFSLARNFEQNREKIRSKVKEELSRLSIEKGDDHVNAITEMLEHVLQVQAFRDMPSFRLCDLDDDSKASEMEFLITTGTPKSGRETLNAKTLGELLKKLDSSYSGLELSELEMKGYLTGSIDLAFLAEDKFWIIDWKSNFLSPNLNDYQGKFLDQAMTAKHYKLQYLLYTVALKRRLEVRLGIDNGYDKIGGVAYFFLRGVHLKHPSRGIFFDRPKKYVIDCLDDVLTNGYSEVAVEKYLSLAGGKNG